ncbi:MAG: hypothetical protein HUK23_06090 [Sphaerochaetaceae bacterium]|nr:hypothetical protein [Sphaerochaetaceae bacterium]
MKKALVVLLMIATVFTYVFAAAQELKIVLDSVVDKVAPAFKLEGTMGDFESGVATATEAAQTTLDSNLSIASSDITAHFRVTQTGEARYKGLVTLDISVGDLVEQTTDEIKATVSGAVNNISNGVITTYSSKHGGTTENVNNKVTLEKTASALKATFNGKSVDQVIGTFDAKWLQDDRVPNGTYMADIKINYVVD